MTATQHATHTPHRHAARRLVVVGKTHRARLPVSGTLGLFAAGMTPGFLLASIASAQGGAGMVHTELILAAASAIVAVAAGTRARHIQRRRERHVRARATGRRPSPAHLAQRRAA